jgi:hypothetical protein
MWVQFPSRRCQNSGVQAGRQDGGPCHVSDSDRIRGSYALGVTRYAVLGVSRALSYPSVATADEVKQIKLSEKQMQGFIAVSESIAQLYDGASQDRPDPKLELQAEALVKKHGFVSLGEYDDVLMNIAMIMSGFDPQTKGFTEPPEQIKQQIDAVRSDKSVPEHKRKRTWCNLRPPLRMQSQFSSGKTLHSC